MKRQLDLRRHLAILGAPVLQRESRARLFGQGLEPVSRDLGAWKPARRRLHLEPDHALLPSRRGRSRVPAARQVPRDQTDDPWVAGVGDDQAVVRQALDDSQVRALDGRLRVRVANDEETAILVQRIVQAGVPVYDVRQVGDSLEDLFVRVAERGDV